MKKSNLMRSGFALLTALLLLGLAGCPDGDPAKKKPDPKPPTPVEKSDNAKLKGLSIGGLAVADFGTGAATAAAATAGTATIFSKSVAVVPETEEAAAEVDWQVVADLGDLAEADYFPSDPQRFTASGEKLVVRVTAPNGTNKLYYVINVTIVNVSLTSITINGETLSGGTLPQAGGRWDEPKLERILYGADQPALGSAIAAVGSAGSSVTWALVTPGVGPGTYGTTSPILFENGQTLSVKVTDDADENASAYYLIGIFLQMTGEIYYGTPTGFDATSVNEAEWPTNTFDIRTVCTVEGDPGNEFIASPTTTGVAKFLYDEEALYVYAIITDDDISATAADSQHHQKDSFEVFVNEDFVGHKTGGHGAAGAQYRFGANGELSGDPDSYVATWAGTPPALTGGVLYTEQQAGNIGIAKDTNTYTIVARIPWRFKGLYPIINNKEIGLELQINESEGDAQRRAVIVWNNFATQNYGDVSKYAKVTLVPETIDGTPVTLKMDAVAPTINKHPASDWFYDNDIDGVLTVDAVANDVDGNGTPVSGGALSYEWFSGTSFTSITTSVGSDSDSFTIPNNLSEGTYYYKVKVTNTNNNVGGTVKVNSVESAPARIQIFESGETIVEQLVLGENVAIYAFDLPGGASWSDYEELKVDYKFDADNLAKSIRFNRIYGSYKPTDFTFDGTSKTSAAFDTYGTPWLIADNGGAWAPLSTTTYVGLAADAWYTMTYKVDGSTANSGFNQANKPSGQTAYFGIGIPAQNGNTITQLVKNVTLVHKTNNTNNIVSKGSGLPAQAFAGYPDAARLGASSRIYTTEAAGPVQNPKVEATANGTLLTDRFNSGASSVIEYDGKEWWALARSTPATGSAVDPFDSTEAAKFTEIVAEVATYARVSIDLSTIDANWDGYSKVTLTYDMVQVGGTDLGVLFRNGTGGGGDPTVNATTGGYATTLVIGAGQTVTLPIGEADENIKPSVGPDLAVVKKNDADACILLRITKIELSN